MGTPGSGSGSDEARRTAEAFNRMTGHLRHYFQEAVSKTERLEEGARRNGRISTADDRCAFEGALIIVTTRRKGLLRYSA